MLTDLRRDIKGAIEDILRRPSGEKRISVWINEDSAATDGGSSWYDESMRQVRHADIVVVLFSGDAGSLLRGRNIGICHAELQAALSDAPTKLRRIDVRGLIGGDQQAKGPMHDRFVDAFEDLAAVDARPQTSDQALKDAVDAVSSAIHELALGGITGARRGTKSLGAALDWRRLTFAERKTAMEQALVSGLVADGGTGLGRRGAQVSLDIRGEPVLFAAVAAPEGLSLAKSRELVGQPHRDDHLHMDALDGRVGPVHLLACPAGVTASQMRALMGATELVIADTSTGIWAADAISRGQVLALRDCIDATAVHIQLEAALDWLRRSGEDVQLLSRARRRRAIIEATAASDDP